MLLRIVYSSKFSLPRCGPNNGVDEVNCTEVTRKQHTSRAISHSHHMLQHSCFVSQALSRCSILVKLLTRHLGHTLHVISQQRHIFLYALIWRMLDHHPKHLPTDSFWRPLLVIAYKLLCCCPLHIRLLSVPCLGCWCLRPCHLLALHAHVRMSLSAWRGASLLPEEIAGCNGDHTCLCATALLQHIRNAAS